MFHLLATLAERVHKLRPVRVIWMLMWTGFCS
jgi:hypothetical protein